MAGQYPGEQPSRPHPQNQDPRYGQPWPQQGQQPYGQPQGPWPPQPPQGQWPPQAQQPYGQNQFPPHWPQQQYQPPQPPGPPRQRRRRGGLRAFAFSFFGVLGAIIVIAIAVSGGNHTVTTGSASVPASSSSEIAAASPAAIGSTITLAGNDNGEQMAVTVVKVISDAQPAGEFDSAPTGDRLYAVQFRLADTGSAAYSDSPSNGAAVVDSAGQSYQSGVEDVTECVTFPGSENLAPGASGLGCVVFEVPRTAVITEVQFTLDSGMGPQTGQWKVRG